MSTVTSTSSAASIASTIAAATSSGSSATTTSSTSSANSDAVSSSAATATSTATTAYNTFLKLLTTQLQNQDPLNPTDTNQFTSEMIQLSGVEQQLQTNSTLSTINTDLTGLTASSSLGYMGKTITATGNTVALQNGQATWDYNINGTAQSTTLSIQNSAGATVWTGTGATTTGSNTLTWNGTDSSGNTVPAGDYTLTVTATSAAGQPLAPTTSVVGTVTGVDTSGSAATLQIGDTSVLLSNVTGLSN